MAHIVENLGVSLGNTGFRSMIERIGARFKQRSVYNRTHAELSQLSTRELDDLGISRSMISRLAYEAAYGR
ncbi:DUF1127 domain-containing protein [Roseinatronobacter monicus]|uniref:DUF1127 domain-containing protein n=1 Tax=Roseinatronobacter monicus TaxID=393481 RepID=UPI003F3A7126